MNICIAALFLTHSYTANPLTPTEWSHRDQIKQGIFRTVAQHSHFPNHAFYFTFVYSKHLICIKRPLISYRRSKDSLICYFNDKTPPKLKLYWKFKRCRWKQQLVQIKLEIPSLFFLQVSQHGNTAQQISSICLPTWWKCSISQQWHINVFHSRMVELLLRQDAKQRLCRQSNI